jgi:hypothetical protein
MSKEKWVFRPRQYPHFDIPVTSYNKTLAFVSSPNAVAKHSFRPFLEYKIINRRFSKYLEKTRREENGEDASDIKVNKERPIKYAAHKDAQIYSYYRFMLAEKYEQHLQALGLTSNVIAYRKIQSAPGSGKGKCNIHFAKEAFDEVVKRGDASAITLDISGFFESLDHDFLYKKWCFLLGEEELPPDHKKVFGSLTNYHVVDHDKCYEALGFIAIKDGKKKYIHCPHHIFRKRKILSDTKTYREKIISGGLVRSNSDKNGNPSTKGIPQGSPISDMLANFYMLDFDAQMKALEKKYNAYYRRYSDDILWICNNQDDAVAIEAETVRCIKEFCGGTLEINKSKTTRSHFSGQKCAGDSFSYLGFSFDGITARLRDPTISRLERNTSLRIKSFVRASNIKDKSGNSIQPLNISLIHHKVGFANKKYVDRQKKKGVRPEANFMNYHLRALRIFNDDPNRKYNLSDKVLRSHKKFIKRKLNELQAKQGGA